MNIPFFRSLTPEETRAFLARDEVKRLHFERDTFVFEQGDTPRYVYILMEGEVQVEATAEDGRRTILNRFTETGTVFAEVYSYLTHKTYDYSCRATEDATVLAIDKELLKPGHTDEPVAQKLLFEMLTILSEKAFALNRKLLIISEMTLRQKILKYLEQRTPLEHVEFNREEMADFLGTTRPSLSREIRKMEDEGLIRVDGRSIHLI